MQVRTDLALEAKEIAGGKMQGVQYDTQKYRKMTVTRMRITQEEAAKKMQKETGTYITIELPPLTDDFRETDQRLLIIAEEIRSLLPEKGLVLVTGLGNLNITPDALGPKAGAQVLATRHITGELARSTGLDALRPVAVLAPGVLGQTGIETGELIFSVVQKIRPSAVIAIDALASRRLERLGCTMQISDTGISPGAGVGNHRLKINKKTMGVPVIAIGVPTVVDAVTLASDLLLDSSAKTQSAVRRTVSPNGQTMVVTPREIDLLIERGAKLISMAVNCALHPDFTLSDLLSLVG
ncbi:MAG: GPR endopeptidase [Acutalibacteraceae bacterium]|mgnify:FL=1|nr:GPR endopeptidase [Acutalibacteraceae bacterium]HIR04041.1 GPR endopeptidase [Candidatus Scatovicinus merdipullorum]